MERQLKERLVGAAVLMAAAIILIPEMLSGPKRESRAPQAAKVSGDGSLKTYTIDLNRPPGSTPSTTVTEPLDERAPPPESGPSETAPETQPEPEASSAQPAPSPATQALPESGEVQVAQNPQSAPPRTSSESAIRTPPSASALTETRSSRPIETAARESTSPKPIASAPAAPTSRGWAVQVGSFASRATADRLVKDLAQQGQSAFVMPVKSGSSTLYRVRVGPFAERAVANDTLREVKGRNANAAVVAHP